MFVGKLIAGLLGLLVAGFPGLLFGLVLGHLFDRGLAAAFGLDRGGLDGLRDRFFRTIFLLMGHIAKADGRISEEEVAHTKQLFAQLGLGDEQRHEAILLFKEGAEADFSVDAAVRAFLQAGGAHPSLRQTLLMFLITLAFADGELHDGERRALTRIGEQLGYAPQAIEELLRMATAQEQFHEGGAAASGGPSLDAAYAALGVSPQASDAEIKKTYRKLMSQHHPDKLSARGVPEDMLKLATEKSQEISAAYDLIRKARSNSEAA